MADRFNLEHNILFLQAILERISDKCEKCGKLVEKCRRYAENNSSVLYLEKDETPPGIKAFSKCDIKWLIYYTTAFIRV